MGEEKSIPLLTVYMSMSQSREFTQDEADRYNYLLGV